MTSESNSKAPPMPSMLRQCVGFAFVILLSTCVVVAIHEVAIGGFMRREFFIGYSSALLTGWATFEFVRRFVFNPPKTR